VLGPNADRTITSDDVAGDPSMKVGVTSVVTHDVIDVTCSVLAAGLPFLGAPVP
jgi:hypothetical protein